LRNAKQQYHHYCRTSYSGRATATQEEYLLAKFLYNTIDDTYECPQGETLKRYEGVWPKNRTHRDKVDTNFRNTSHKPCKTCPIDINSELEL
jgi:hypothetical protein